MSTPFLIFILLHLSLCGSHFNVLPRCMETCFLDSCPELCTSQLSAYWHLFKMLMFWSLGGRIPKGRRPSFDRGPSRRMGPRRVLEGRCPFLQWTIPTRIEQGWTDDPLRLIKPPLSGHTHHSFVHVIHNYEGGNPRTYATSTPCFLHSA